MQKRNTFPVYTTPYFYVKMYPKALLEPFPQRTVGEKKKKEEEEGRVGMSVNFLVVKKNTHKSACVRRRMVNKLKTVLNMIVARGADAREGELVFNEREGGQDWIVSGEHHLLGGFFQTFWDECVYGIDWTYMFFPAIETYQAPYTALVPAMRKTLKELRDKAQRMQRRWTTTS
jgi:hypothetical protein